MPNTRVARSRVPEVAPDPSWTIDVSDDDSSRRGVAETLSTLGAGGMATRGALEETPPGADPMVLASGVYTDGTLGERLLPGPLWTAVEIAPAPAAARRVLDLRTGVLVREERVADRPLRTVRFASAARPGVVALRAEAAAGRLRPGPALQAPSGVAMAEGIMDGRHWAQVGTGAGIAAMAVQRHHDLDGLGTIERICAYVPGSHGLPPPAEAARLLDDAERAGFDRLLFEHSQVWDERWAAVNVDLPDDPDAQLSLRYALFQLWCNVGGAQEAAVGARGVSGMGYAGHVFWDADVFVLPAVASMDPALARAMLVYRIRRLPAARAAASAGGHGGARFPWESGSDGRDVTPTSGYLGGQRVKIKTGQLEEHITADVAWAAWHYQRWTGERRFLRGPGRALLVETARYWASRCRTDRDGRAHIDGVIGPDEYHEPVDDNAYTNVMARWNLRTAAAQLPDSGAIGGEARRWRRIASALVDGYDEASGRYEQFAGYFAREPLLVADVVAPPVALDVLLGRDRVTASQSIKQPDVLMLHHLVPDEVAPGSLAPNLDFYGPRTAHGSSLSPAISACLLARAGRADEALSLLRIALRLDLDDLTGSTSTGLHLATMGGCWQAVLSGFAGVRVRDGVLTVDPHLPSSWGGLGLRFRCLRRCIRLRITHADVTIGADAPLRVRIAGHPLRTVTDETLFSYAQGREGTKR